MLDKEKQNLPTFVKYEPLVSPIFTELSKPWLDYLHLAHKREYKAGAFIINPGDNIADLYYVKSGEALVSSMMTDAVETAIFIARKNSFLGLIGLFAPATTYICWRALTDCVIYHFSRQCIYDNIPAPLLLNLLEHLARLARNMSTRLSLDHSKQNETRLANLIGHLIQTCPASQQDGVFCVTPGLTQGMLSELLGIHPVSLNKLLSRFRDEGILGKFTKNRLEILDMDKLHSYL